eukprot:gene2541-biopygen2921
MYKAGAIIPPIIMGADLVCLDLFGAYQELTKELECSHQRYCIWWEDGTAVILSVPCKLCSAGRHVRVKFLKEQPSAVCVAAGSRTTAAGGPQNQSAPSPNRSVKDVRTTWPPSSPRASYLTYRCCEANNCGPIVHQVINKGLAAIAGKGVILIFLMDNKAGQLWAAVIQGTSVF